MRRMPNSTDLLAAALCLAAVLPAGAALAQDPVPAPAPPSTVAAPASAQLADLRRTVEERYDVLPSRDGLVLVPRDEVPGIRSIEIVGGEVAINGEAVSRTILRSWLGDEAEPLLELAGLPAGEARELFGPFAAEGAGEAAADDDGEEGEEGEAGPVAPAPPRPPRTGTQVGDRVSFGSGVVVDEGEVASEAVSIGGSVRVLGVVEGDVVAIGGSVTVEGEVEGEVVAVGGHVRLGPEARVGNGITAVGGRVDRAEGAIVDGEIMETGFPPFWSGERFWRPGDRHRQEAPVRSWEVDDAFFNLMWMVVLALLVCLALLLARGVIERSETRVRGEFWVAGLVGLATQLQCLPVLFVVTLILIVTVVGCLALPLIPIAVLALVVAAFFGYAAVALTLGRHVLGRFGRPTAGLYVPALVGVLLIEVWGFVGEALDVLGGPAWVFALIFGVFGALVEYVAWTVGLGAVVMTLFAGRRPPPPALPSSTLPPLPPSHPPAYGPGSPGIAAGEAAPGASSVEATPDAGPAAAASVPAALDHAGESGPAAAAGVAGGLPPESAGVPSEAGAEGSGDEGPGAPGSREAEPTR